MFSKNYKYFPGRSNKFQIFLRYSLLINRIFTVVGLHSFLLLLLFVKHCKTVTAKIYITII